MADNTTPSPVNPKEEEISQLLQRLDELSFTEGVDSQDYQETLAKLGLKQKEHGLYEEVSDES